MTKPLGLSLGTAAFRTLGKAAQSVNGVEFTTGVLEVRPVVLFLSGINLVNAVTTVHLALDDFFIEGYCSRPSRAGCILD